MKASDINHLHRLLGWVRCEIGQSPDEMVETVRAIGFRLGEISDDGKGRLVAAHDAASAVPAYVRAAVKALEKTYGSGGDVVDAEASLPKLPESP